MATEKRLIDADDALEQLKQAEKEMKVVTPLGCKAVDIKAVLKYIESRPTVDAVEVVCCWECKFWDMCSIREAMAVSDWNAYCYRGERKHND